MRSPQKKFKRILPAMFYKIFDKIMETVDFTECSNSYEACTRVYEAMYLEGFKMADYIKQLEEDNEKLLRCNGDMITVLKTNHLTLPESVLGKRSHVQEAVDLTLSQAKG